MKNLYTTRAKLGSFQNMTLWMWIISLAFAAPQPLPQDLPEGVRSKIEEASQRLLSTDCQFLVQSYSPKDPTITQLAFCVFSETKTQGIYTQSVCAGALVEPISLVKNPMYGSLGHWGVPGKCDGKEVQKKFEDPKETRMTPVKAFKVKREEGMRLRLLRDDLGLWQSFNQLTQPAKK